MIYLDNSATTQPYKEVIDSFVKVSTDYFGNPSSLHGLGGQAERLLSRSREQVATLLNVSPKEIVFTSGGTEGNNMAIKGVAFQYQNRGKHIITTEIEHDSVHQPFKQLEEWGFDVTYLSVNEEGLISVEELKNSLREDTILVSVIHVNNETGVIQPIDEIGHMLDEYPKAIFHVDHVQGIGKVPLDFKKASIDLLTLSGHKFHGLKGTGVLYAREGIKLAPLLSGGEQESHFRSGTENVPGVVALAKALRMTLENADDKNERIKKLRKILVGQLSDQRHLTINSPSHGAPHILNVTFHGMKAEVFVHALEDKGIYVSTTSACSSKKKSPSKTLLAMGKKREDADQAIRISLSYQTTQEDAEKAATAILQAVEELKEVVKEKR